MILKLYKQVGLQGGNILRNIIILVYYIWKSKPTNIFILFWIFLMCIVVMIQVETRKFILYNFHRNTTLNSKNLK